MPKSTPCLSLRTIHLKNIHNLLALDFADGLDTCLSILKVLHNGYGNPKYAPATLLVNMVQAGKLGVKSGEGFYAYTPGSKELVVSASFN